MDITYAIADIHAAAKQLWAEAKQFKVWAFYGEMGAGKTTFIHEVCAVLGVTGAVSSPTFAIINEYSSSTGGTIYHMDWYRLKDEDEAIQAGVEDCLYSGNLCLVEWPAKAEGLLPPNTIKIYITTIEQQRRHIKTGF